MCTTTTAPLEPKRPHRPAHVKEAVANFCEHCGVSVFVDNGRIIIQCCPVCGLPVNREHQTVWDIAVRPVT